MDAPLHGVLSAMDVEVDTSDLWTCPDCGKRFVTRNMSHSCGPHTIDAFMEGKGPIAWAYWEKLQEMVGRCGPYTIVANKTGLAFMVRVRFAGISTVSERGVSLAFWLKERIESSRFRKVDYYGHRDWVYFLRVTTLDDLDDEIQGWLCRAYEVGCQLA